MHHVQPTLGLHIGTLEKIGCFVNSQSEKCQITVGFYFHVENTMFREDH